MPNKIQTGSDNPLKRGKQTGKDPKTGSQETRYAMLYFSIAMLYFSVAE